MESPGFPEYTSTTSQTIQAFNGKQTMPPQLSRYFLVFRFQIDLAYKK